MNCVHNNHYNAENRQKKRAAILYSKLKDIWDLGNEYEVIEELLGVIMETYEDWYTEREEKQMEYNNLMTWLRTIEDFRLKDVEFNEQEKTYKINEKTKQVIGNHNELFESKAIYVRGDDKIITIKPINIFNTESNLIA